MKITEDMLYKSAPKAEELWLNSLPTDDEIPNHKFSRRFNRKMKKLIREQRRSPIVRQTIYFLKNTVAVILIVATLSFCCLMTVDAYRAKFIEIVTEIFHDFTHFSFFSSRNDDTEFCEIKFNYLPDNMREVSREDIDDSKCRIIRFESADGQQLKVRQQLVTNVTNADVILDTENTDIMTIDIGDSHATLVVKDGNASLFWEDDTYLLIITGDLTQDEILKIAINLSIEY